MKSRVINIGYKKSWQIENDLSLECIYDVLRKWAEKTDNASLSLSLSLSLPVPLVLSVFSGRYGKWKGGKRKIVYVDWIR